MLSDKSALSFNLCLANKMRHIKRQGATKVQCCCRIFCNWYGTVIIVCVISWMYSNIDVWSCGGASVFRKDVPRTKEIAFVDDIQYRLTVLVIVLTMFVTCAKQFVSFDRFWCIFTSLTMQQILPLAALSQLVASEQDETYQEGKNDACENDNSRAEHILPHALLPRIVILNLGCDWVNSRLPSVLWPAGLQLGNHIESAPGDGILGFLGILQPSQRVKPKWRKHFLALFT